MAKLQGKRFEIEGEEYIFLKHLADGGNASLWSAENNDKKYAVKILNEEGDGKKERFKKEIEFCKKNKHNNLVTIYTHGEINNKLCYVMPLYENNLAKLIINGIDLERGFNYIFQICSALEFLHNKNVIHRDLKPENILVKKDKLVLADLGIAHFEDSSITHKNDLLANRGYAAPEQKIKGKSKYMTAAVDIFSLGLIINEIFTSKKPEGSHFTLISDVYPWLIDIDELVKRCIRQNSIERPTIKEVSLEVKSIFAKLEDEINSIKEYLEDDFEEARLNVICDNETKDKIIKQAANDILAAKYFFEYKTAHDLKKYNYNYHCNIHYKLDRNLRSAYMEYLLKKRCRRTFLYESNVYKNGITYEPLNLNDKFEDKILYEKFLDFLKEHSVVNGELLKLFHSCCDYHCEEIIRDLDEIQKRVEDLDDAPILYIIMNIINIKDDNYDISCEDGILINWEKSVLYYDSNDTYSELLKEDNQDEQEEIEEILKKFNEEYHAIVTKKDRGFIVRFEEQQSYTTFKNYALELSKPYYIFKGDVLDIVRIEREYEDIIELKLWNSFDVKNVLAKILGLREDYS